MYLAPRDLPCTSEVTVTLYYSPLSCSLAARIALAEGGLAADFVEVDRLTKRLVADGGDYFAVHPLGVVPTLLTDDVGPLTENVAVLTWIGERTGRLPAAPRDRALVLQWLGFIATELHKGTFAPFFDPAADEPSRAYALRRTPRRLAYLDAALAGRDVLVGDTFTVADAYLVTALNWAQATPVDLAPYPHVAAYLDRHRARPTVAAALAEELPRYVAATRRAKAAS